MQAIALMHALHEGLGPGGGHAARRRRWDLGPVLGQARALVADTVRAWLADNAQSRAAALAFYGVFSFAPTLLIALAIAGAVLGPEAARGELVQQLQGALGDGPARAVEQLVASAWRPGRGVGASLLAMAMLTFSATGAFVELQQALNTFWKVQSRRKVGALLEFLLERAISMAVLLALGILLLASVLVSAALSSFGAVLPPHLVWLVGLVDDVVSAGAITGLLAMVFKYLPERKVAWKDVWVGALVTSLLLSLGKVAISALLMRQGLASAWGAASAIIVLLAWAYYASMILFLGAELTQVFARRHGSLRDGGPRPGAIDASRSRGR